MLLLSTIVPITLPELCLEILGGGSMPHPQVLQNFANALFEAWH